MKKLIFAVIVSILSTLMTIGRAHAGENITQEEINHEDIPALEIDPTKELPDYEILPKPTPPPEIEEFTTDDKRSWSKSPYKMLIDKAAKRYDLDPQVIYATIMTESDGDKYAFRYEPDIKDASLCMGQILISTAKRLGFEGDVTYMYKPEVCIDLIGRYHKEMIEEHGDLSPIELARAYNTGSPWKTPVPGHLYRFRKWYFGEQG